MGNRKREISNSKKKFSAQPSLLTLLEIRKHAPFLIGGKMEIYLDGGIRRGSDVVKALALGATAVGLGRPFLFSLAGYGESGVRRMVRILRDEVANNMALAGACSIAEITPEMVNTSKLQRDLIDIARL
jgi:L-lactate dehydrogenase (cytochrome)